MARVYVVNEPGVELLRRANPAIADRIEFLPVWFDDEVFRPPAVDERAALRDRLAIEGLAESDRLVLFAGRLEEVKDPLLALAAFAAFADMNGAGRHARMLVAGDGELRAAHGGPIRDARRGRSSSLPG